MAPNGPEYNQWGSMGALGILSRPSIDLDIPNTLLPLLDIPIVLELHLNIHPKSPGNIVSRLSMLERGDNY